MKQVSPGYAGPVPLRVSVSSCGLLTFRGRDLALNGESYAIGARHPQAGRITSDLFHHEHVHSSITPSSVASNGVTLGC